MTFCIQGLGTATPDHAISQPDAAKLAATFCGGDLQQQGLLPKLYARSGVNHRHSVLLESPTSDGVISQSFYPPDPTGSERGPTTGERMLAYRQHAAELAQRAATNALSQAALAGAEITDLITVSCSGFAAPGVDVQLIRMLGLSPDVSRTHVGFMGCHGALNGLRVANALAQARTNSAVLLVAVELCSLHQQYGWNTDRIVSNALFADGAAALVGSTRQTDTCLYRLRATGSTLIPDTESHMEWLIGDHGFEMSLSPRVPAVIRGAIRPWIANWLGNYGLDIAEVASWVVHPGGPRILSATAEGLELSNEALRDSVEVLAEYGNMSSPTVLFILQRHLARRAARPCVVLGFGPGLAIEAALLD